MYFFYIDIASGITIINYLDCFVVLCFKVQAVVTVVIIVNIFFGQRGFEPRYLHTVAFKTTAFDHSAIRP